MIKNIKYLWWRICIATSFIWITKDLNVTFAWNYSKEFFDYYEDDWHACDAVSEDLSYWD